MGIWTGPRQMGYQSERYVTRGPIPHYLLGASRYNRKIRP